MALLAQTEAIQELKYHAHQPEAPLPKVPAVVHVQWPALCVGARAAAVAVPGAPPFADLCPAWRL